MILWDIILFDNVILLVASLTQNVVHLSTCQRYFSICHMTQMFNNLSMVTNILLPTGVSCNYHYNLSYT